MGKAFVAWTDDRLNDLAAEFEPVPTQLAMLNASAAHFEHIAAQMEPLPAQIAVLAASVERLTDEHRSLRAELAATQRQLVQISWVLMGALMGAAAALANALL
jgi:hypothetical protein